MARKHYEVIEENVVFGGTGAIADGGQVGVGGYLAEDNATGVVELFAEGIELEGGPAAADEAGIYRGTTGLIPLGDVISVSFLFEPNGFATTAKDLLYMGLAYDGTAPQTAAASAVNLTFKLNALALDVVADIDDGTVTYSETGVATLVNGTWYTATIDLNYEVLTQSPPSLSKGLVAKFSIEDSNGFQRKLSTGTTVFNMSTASAIMVAPVALCTAVTTLNAALKPIIRQIKWKYRL